VNYWDTELIGFGLRVTSTGERTYVVKYRAGGRPRWFTIGKHGSPWAPEQARREALRILGEVARGGDPADRKAAERNAMSFGALCDLYLSEGVAHKKASSIKADRGRISHHLKPLLGAKRVDSVDRGDIERLMIEVTSGRSVLRPPKDSRRKAGSIAKGGMGVAARCVDLASAIFAFAVSRRLRADNPARGIKRPKSRRHERFLSDAEIAALADSLDRESEVSGAFGVAAIKLLMFTGCRRSEVLRLCWRDVDFERRCLRLPDSKTGPKTIYLNAPAVALLEQLPRVEGNPHVIVGNRPGSPLIGIDKLWFRTRNRAGLGDVRLHDLRHSFASIGAIGGLSLPVIGALLGHKHSTTTARYAHLSADPLRAANESVGAWIAAAMAKKPDSTNVVPLNRAG
jgi:integrase